jgi:peptidyl-prolyl cis-trans isomerase C
MSIRLTACSAALALALGAAPVAAQDTATASTVLATVNGVEITMGHLLMLRSQLPQEYQGYPDNVLYDGLLDQAIQQALLAGSVETVSPIAQFALDTQTRSILANESMRQISDDAVSEAAIEAAYQARFGDAEPSRQFDAAHILVETEEEAAALVAELEAGADFAALARERSTGPSGPNGGSLGWFGLGAMVPAFEEAVVALEPGQVSGPVQTQFGWHVIRLNDTRMEDVPTLDSVRDQLLMDVQSAAIEARLDDLTAAADVQRTALEDIDPSFLSNIDLLEP